MCYQVVERYLTCRCLYHKHPIDPCTACEQRGHIVQEKTILVGYTCNYHSDRQINFDKDAGNRNADATSEADIPDDDQSMELPTKTASMEPGIIMTSGGPTRCSRNIKPVGGDSKDILLAIDESYLAKSRDDATSLRDLEKWYLAAGAGQGLDALGLEEQRNPYLKHVHEPRTADDALVFGDTGSNTTRPLLQTLTRMVKEATDNMNSINLAQIHANFEGYMPNPKEQRTPDSEDNHESHVAKAATIADTSGTSLANSEDRTSSGAALIGLQGEETRRKQTDAVLLAIRQAQDRVKLVESGDPLSSEMLASNGGRQLFATCGGLLGLGPLTTPETQLSLDDQQFPSQGQEFYSDKLLQVHNQPRHPDSNEQPTSKLQTENVHDGPYDGVPGDSTLLQSSEAELPVGRSYANFAPPASPAESVPRGRSGKDVQDSPEVDTFLDVTRESFERRRKRQFSSGLRERARPLTRIQLRACSNCSSRKIRGEPGTPCQPCTMHYQDGLAVSPYERSSKPKSRITVSSADGHVRPSALSIGTGSHSIFGEFDLAEDPSEGTRFLWQRQLSHGEEMVAPGSSRTSAPDDTYDANVVRLDRIQEPSIIENPPLTLSDLGSSFKSLAADSSTEDGSVHALDRNRFTISKKGTSVVIYGVRDHKWHGYAFGKLGPEDPTLRETDDTWVEGISELSVEEAVRASFINRRGDPVGSSHIGLYEPDPGNGFSETRSEPSSYAASVFSVASLASSASNFSNSRYSPKQIATATKELFDVFVKDSDLIDLYQRAINDPEIGPERLQRNLRRLFKAYAKNLEDEHTESLEYQASKLVAFKSGPLARAIAEKFYCTPVDEQAGARMVQDDSSEDEAVSQPVDEKIFEDLKAFRNFLTNTAAFEIFRAQIRSFVVPRSEQVILTELAPIVAKSSDTSLHEGVKEATIPTTWQSWRVELAQAVDVLLIDRNPRLAARAASCLVFDAFALATDWFFIPTGILEPLLSPEMIRLRWRCTCGDRLFSDINELQENGVQELAARMEHSSGIKVAVAGYDQRSGNQRYTLPRHSAWFGGSSGVCQTNQTGNIPMLSKTSSTSASTTTCTFTQGISVQKQMLHLMACMHNKRSSRILHQDRIEDVTTDCELICFLRRQYRTRRSRLRSFLSLKTVQSIDFVKFQLPMGNNVIVHRHEVSCVPFGNLSSTTPTAMCACLPPRTKVEPTDTAEYHCQPVPPKTFPPVPPEYLLSLFTCQEQPHQMSRWIIEQLPKRKWGELFGKPEQPAEGWGIYYKEGWDTSLIAIVVFLLLSASLLFSVLWTTLRDDIQGAFGVGAWMVGIGGALLAVIVTQADSV